MTPKRKRTSVNRVFIANRGEIACRIISACRSLGITSILGFSAADRNSLASRLADEAICIGDSDASKSYLSIPAIIEAAKSSNADAIHPGYGFLSEKPAFSSACQKAGLIFIGPSAKAMTILGDKVNAKNRAQLLKIPLLSCTTIQAKDLETPNSASALQTFLKRALYPLLVKSAAGGGGRGMRLIHGASEAVSLLQAASREALSLFGNGDVFIEPFIKDARHVEIQIAASQDKKVTAIGSRDCSLQRRYQKIIEEAPASSISPHTERKLFRAAESLVSGVGYTGLATVEFLVTEDEEFFFLEVNTRLQVEHPVTEVSLGIDLVQIQIGLANGRSISTLISPKTSHSVFAIEARVCAEKMEKNSEAATGRIDLLKLPSQTNSRVDTGIDQFDNITHHYDSMIAKVLGMGNSRGEAINQLCQNLAELHVAPIATNINALSHLLCSTEFKTNTHNLQSAEKIIADYAKEIEKKRELAIVSATLHKLGLQKEHPSSSPWESERLWSNTNHISYRLNWRCEGEHFLIEAGCGSGCDLQVNRVIEKTAYNLGNINSVKVSETGVYFKMHGNEHFAHIQRLSQGYYSVTIFDARFLISEDLPWRTRSSKPRPGPGESLILAHLPGRIAKFSVSVGSFVAEGSELLVLESMKMEHIVRAPKEGRVVSCLKKEGDLVLLDETIMSISDKT